MMLYKDVITSCWKKTSQRKYLQVKHYIINMKKMLRILKASDHYKFKLAQKLYFKVKHKVYSQQF